MVKCYLCGSDVEVGPCQRVLGLGPVKHVCPLCVKTVVVAIVQEVHNEKNAASRRYLAKGRSGEQG
jgi:hypothetical protein